MDISAIVGELKKERDRIDSAIKALSGAGGSSVGRKSGVKRVLSAAARARIAEAQRQRWAKVKAAKKKG
jgi:hypothetical protein